jgi:hypothetical protein
MSQPPFGDPGVCPTIALFSYTTNQSPIGGSFSTTWIRLRPPSKPDQCRLMLPYRRRLAAPPHAASFPQPTRATNAERSRIIFFAPIFRRALPATLMLWKSYKTNPDKINVRSTTLI